MVHTYECLGRHFALDVESGSVYVVDELTSELIKAKSPSAEAKGDFSGYDGAEVAEAEAEIDELIRRGILFFAGARSPRTGIQRNS